MANKTISQVNLNNTIYDIYDASALHSQDLVSVLFFKGSQTDEAAIKALTNQSKGWIWHASTEGTEWLCTIDVGSTANEDAWEEIGNPFVDTHVHALPTLSGSIDTGASAAAQQWTQNTGSIKTGASAAAQQWTQGTSNVAVTGTNAASTVTGAVSVSVTTPTHKYLSASLSDAPVLTPETDSVLGTGTTFTASGTTVASTGTAPAITGFGEHSTAAAITELNSTTVQEVKSITEGEAAQWSASVDDAGILSFSFTTNKPTKIEKGASTNLATPTAKNIVEAITALGTATTQNCLTGVQVTAQPTIAVGTNDQVAAVTSATVSKPSITLTANASTATGRIKYTETTSDSNDERNLINGSAAAQKWTQGESSVTVTGTNKSSAVTGDVIVTGTNKSSAVTGSVTIDITNKVTGKPQ